MKQAHFGASRFRELARNAAQESWVMDLKQLRVFAEVARAGSLSRLGVIQGVAQSALSKQIGSLEREFGGKLFYRTGRGVVLTEFGEAILPRAQALLAESDQLMGEVEARAAVPSGSVNIGIPSWLASPLVTLLFQRIRRAYPKIQIQVIEGSSGQVNEMLANSRADIGVTDRYGASASGAEPLMVVDLCLIGPVGDRVTAGRTVAFEKLIGLPLVLPGNPSGLRTILDDEAKRRRAALSVAMQIDSLAVIIDIVVAGGGYAIVPMQAIAREIVSKRLQASRIVEPSLECAVVLATGTHRPLTTASRVVARVIRELIGDLNKAGQWQVAATPQEPRDRNNASLKTVPRSESIRTVRSPAAKPAIPTVRASAYDCVPAGISGP